MKKNTRSSSSLDLLYEKAKKLINEEGWKLSAALRETNIDGGTWYARKAREEGKSWPASQGTKRGRPHKIIPAIPLSAIPKPQKKKQQPIIMPLLSTNEDDKIAVIVCSTANLKSILENL